MKKITKILCALLIAISFVACEGPEGPRGSNGIDGESTYWYPANITIDRSQWRLSGNTGDLNSYYYAEVPFPALSRLIFEEGAVIAYIEPEQGVKNGLPYVLHRGEKDGEKEYLWTQTYDFDYEIGYMTFYLTYSDFKTDATPETETFHVLLIY